MTPDELRLEALKLAAQEQFSNRDPQQVVFIAEMFLWFLQGRVRPPSAYSSEHDPQAV
jgi:hypothetical protein